jgi:hypothetical protein
MGLSRDKITGAYKIDINYKREEWGANFYIPKPVTQNSTLTFDKAESFGFKITMPYNFIYEPQRPNSFLKGSNAPSAKEDHQTKYDDGVIFDLGLSIELPPGTAFLIYALDKNFENYVIDNGEPGRFYPIKLYCKKGKGNIKEFKEGEPILWILPVPDMAYSYQYRNKGLNNG